VGADTALTAETPHRLIDFLHRRGHPEQLEFDHLPVAFCAAPSTLSSVAAAVAGDHPACDEVLVATDTGAGSPSDCRVTDEPASEGIRNAAAVAVNATAASSRKATL
jgi:hypothetical protein